MGRHSSRAQGPFYRSIIVWALPWLMIAAVVLVAVIIAIDAVGGDDLDAVPAADQTRSVAPEPTEEPSPTSEPVETATPEPQKRPKREPKDDKVELITDVTVQVLNGTAATDADDRMADRLSELGYEVVSIEGSSKQYSATTVFWSHPDAQKAAEALAERFGWIAQPKPENLSATVDLHVVVGSDEA
ncbi:MAG: LytR C-terminal domain-containing protein [Actinomycetota bacterium]|nr:LytR C-terminal domain-containing protein [Actinomycetota bacterium]